MVAERGLLALSGVPVPDLNFCLLDEWPGAAAFLTRAVERTRARSLPAVVFVSARAAATAEHLAADLGLAPAGRAPLMAFDGDPPTAAGAYELVDANGSAQLLAESADLQSAAFDLDRQALASWMSARAWPADSEFRCYLARRDGRTVSTVSVSGPGPVAGIWSMATPPDLQGQGAGRAALLSAMSRARGRGAESFYLMASEAGKRLYDKIGFRVVEEFPIYVVAAAA